MKRKTRPQGRGRAWKLGWESRALISAPAGRGVKGLAVHENAWEGRAESGRGVFGLVGGLSRRCPPVPCRLSTWLAGQAIRTIERAIRMAESSALFVSDGEFIRSARCGGRLSERQPAVSPSEHRCRSRLLTHARGRPGWRPLSFQKKRRRKPGLSSIGLVTPLQDLVRADPEQCESDLLQHRLSAGESDSWRGRHV